MLDLSNMDLPAPAESDVDALDLSGEKGTAGEKIDLSKVSDDELMAELEKRNLLEPEEEMEESVAGMEDDVIDDGLV